MVGTRRRAGDVDQWRSYSHACLGDGALPSLSRAELYERVWAEPVRTLAPKEGKTRNPFRISAIDDPDPRLIGKYQNRTDAAKAVSEVAYQPEPRR